MKYRMMGLVPYNLSPIQQGIQFGHAVVEYMVKYRDYPDLTKWAEEDKTFIILNGGTTNDNLHRKGTLNMHADTLDNLGISYVEFREPDLGDQITAIVFLMDERVWDTEKYPEPVPDRSGMIGYPGGDYQYENAIKHMGGEEIWELRKFLKQFKLA